MVEFKVDGIYEVPGLHIPSWNARCMERTETTVTLAAIGYEDNRDAWKTYKVQYDGDSEVCECWQYYEFKGYIRADNRD